MDHGADWSAWRWRVANAAEARAIDVYVAAAAMACDVQDLEEATAAARETKGRSAVEQMLSMPDPLPVVVVEANWKASAEAAEAPFWKSDLAMAMAA